MCKCSNKTWFFVWMYSTLLLGARHKLIANIRASNWLHWYTTSFTLHYLINVGVRLLIFEQNSTQHVLIPYHTFINFGKLFQSSLKNEQKPQFLIVSIENVHIIFINFSTLYYYSIPYDYSFGLNFPPNMLIPYHTFIR